MTNQIKKIIKLGFKVVNKKSAGEPTAFVISGNHLRPTKLKSNDKNPKK